jgi:hypothetical protein
MMAAHVCGLGGEDAGVLEMDAVPQVVVMSRHGCFVQCTLSPVSVERCPTQTSPHSRWMPYTPDVFNPRYS